MIDSNTQHLPLDSVNTYTIHTYTIHMHTGMQCIYTTSMLPGSKMANKNFNDYQLRNISLIQGLGWLMQLLKIIHSLILLVPGCYEFGFAHVWSN